MFSLVIKEKLAQSALHTKKTTNNWRKSSHLFLKNRIQKQESGRRSTQVLSGANLRKTIDGIFFYDIRGQQPCKFERK